MSRWAKFCGWLLKKMGWTTVGGPAPEDKCVILGVPHTSVWDFVVSYLFYTQFDRTAHVMIKKEFFFWPVGVFLRKVGCIPVDRGSAAAMVKGLIEEMEKAGELSGYVVEIDPDQNVLATSEIEIVIRPVGVGVVRRIRIKIGYAESV